MSEIQENQGGGGGGDGDGDVNKKKSRSQKRKEAKQKALAASGIAPAAAAPGTAAETAPAVAVAPAPVPVPTKAAQAPVPTKAAPAPAPAPTKKSTTSTQVVKEERSVETRMGRRTDDNLCKGLPARPTTGQGQGQVVRTTPVVLFANYFAMTIATNATLYQYAVDFNPPLESSVARNKMIYKRKELGVIACDGQMLYSPKKIPDSAWVEQREESEVQISIRLVKELKPADGVPYQLCNVLMRRMLRELKMVMMGRNYYTSEGKVSFPQHCIELWPGIISSIGPVQFGNALICDISHKAIRLDNVLKTLNDIRSSFRGAPGWQQAAENELVGAIVLTRYNNRTYRVDSIEWNKSPKDKFDWEQHGPTSFAEYILKIHDKKIQDLSQPMLSATCRKRQISIIPELCSRTGLSDQMKSDFRVMGDLAKHTRPDPGKRASDITEFVMKVEKNENSKKLFTSWNIKISPKVTQCAGAVLEPPIINFAGSASTSSMTDFRGERKADWTFAMQKNRIAQPILISSWIVLYPRECANEVQEFAERLIGAGRNVGINIPNPHPVPVNGNRPDDWITALRTNLPSKPQFAMCVLRVDSKDTYNAVKRVCTAEFPVPSQVVKLRTTTNKRLDAILFKIIVQVNCKLGGEPWTVRTSPDFNDTMLVGIDVCHGSGKSVVGLVATTNSTFSKYFSSVVFQGKSQEIVSVLSNFVATAINEYKRKNKKVPRNVIVYRDGVGDGQLEYVLKQEVPQYLIGFDKADKLATPKLAVIIVKKRIHTRLFVASPNSYDNPMAGTVVDSTIMHPGWYDFFLVSQSVNQGTVTPTHYHVIEDQLGLKPQLIQAFTHQ